MDGESVTCALSRSTWGSSPFIRTILDPALSPGVACVVFETSRERAASFIVEKQIRKVVYVRHNSLNLLFSLIFLASPAVFARQSAYPATYEGGSLALSHHKVTATVGGDSVVLKQGRRQIAVPVRNILEISCSTDVRRRMGATVLDVVPMMRLGEAETRYIGVTWTDDPVTGHKTEVLFKLGKSQYREFLSALERTTGIRAVDTNQVPTVVRYDF